MTREAEPRSGEPVSPATLGSVGEDALVSSMISGFRALPGWVQVGPGDDAAVLSVSGALVASTDTLVEGRDFLRAWSTGHDVGVKLAAQNFADIAAMGAIPLALLVSLAAPGSLALQWTSDVVAGLDDETARAGACVIGGDVSSAAEIVLTGTALGRMPEGVAPVLRSGARPGDLVALAGRTGLSAAGWALLQAGCGRPGGPARPVGASRFTTVIEAHLAPRPPYEAGARAARGAASSMIDTSDGLVRDAIRLAAASGVCLDLASTALDPGADLVEAAATLTGTPEALARTWVMTGGEDHALLATFPAGTPLPEGWDRIGVVGDQVASGGTPVHVMVDGERWIGATGWTHFGGSA